MNPNGWDFDSGIVRLLDIDARESVTGIANDEADGNRSEAARKLDINRRLLYDKIEEHEIK